MPEFGSFSGNPKTEWLTDDNENDRNMQMLEEFSYTDPHGRVWIAKKGDIINGASIPRPLWSTVGSPYTDDYRRASIIHDVACDTPAVDRKEADRMFYSACRAGGCNGTQASLLYVGVRLGTWAANNLPEQSIAPQKLLFRKKIAVPFVDESFLKGKLSDISDEIRALPHEADLEKLDSIIAKHINI